jgi:hypothetical protein
VNSAQRRQARRDFPYAVSIKNHEHRVSVAYTWCKKQFGPGTFSSSTDWDSAVFKFHREKDAAFFALKWT